MANKSIRTIIIIIALLSVVALMFFLFLNVERKYIDWERPAGKLYKTDSYFVIRTVSRDLSGFIMMGTTSSLYANETTIRSLPLFYQMNYFLNNRKQKLLSVDALKDIDMVPSELIYDLFSVNRSEAWREFEGIFPVSDGFFQISAPAYSLNRSRAVVTLTLTTGKFTKGMFYCLQKRDGNWFIESKNDIWMVCFAGPKR
ncbi:hypothetical protein KAI78_00625 [bacterium]|nr:hypothetical protein [bacterium]